MNTLTINRFITNNIKSGSQIMVDVWKGYLYLSVHVSLYGRINQCLHYFDLLDYTIYINNIERSWR